MGYLKSTGTVFIYIGLFLALITFLPGLPPHSKFSEYTVLPPQQSLLNQLEGNNRLNDAEILFSGELKGPESFASYNGELYTTIHGGDVVKIVGKHIVPIVKFGKPCDGFWMEKECGRPLGLEFDKKGALYVADTYYGIFKVDVTSGKYEKIVDISVPIDGVAPKLVNSLDIALNGDIYWTDSSSDFVLQDGVYTTLANPCGRLIKYDAATKKNTVLVDNLSFANGVKLSKDESFVVVAETLASRLIKYHIKGPKAGGAEPFIQGLPGMPDNIHSDGKDGFLVAFIVAIAPDHPALSQTLAPHPYIRKMLIRLLHLLEAPFKLVEDTYPNYYSKRITHWIGHFESVSFLHWNQAIILHIDADGKVLDVASSNEGNISSISSAYIFKDHLYLGSPYNEHLARVTLERAFPSIKTRVEKLDKQEVKKTVKPAKDTKPATPTTTQTEQLQQQQKQQQKQKEEQERKQQEQEKQKLKQQQQQEEQKRQQQEQEKQKLKQQQQQQEEQKRQQQEQEKQKLQQQQREEQKRQQQEQEKRKLQQEQQEEQKRQQQEQEKQKLQQQQREEQKRQQQQQEEEKKRQQQKQEEEKKRQQQEQEKQKLQQQQREEQKRQQQEQEKQKLQQQQQEQQKQQQPPKQQPPQQRPPPQQPPQQRPPPQQKEPPQQRQPPQQQPPPQQQRPPQQQPPQQRQPPQP